MEMRKSVFLACPPQAAFELFTTRAGEWWPVSRRHTSDALSTITFDPAGPFEERTSDGSVVPLGRVRSWEPPHRLVLDFYPGTDAEHPTEAEITLVAEGTGTRLTVTHRPTLLSQHLWEQRVSAYDAAWGDVFDELRRVLG